MPHLVILYTANLERDSDMTELCCALANTMLAVKDENEKQVFPIGGVRVLAYPAAHFAVANSSGDHAFVYLNLRMGRGRGDIARKNAGEALTAATRAHFTPILARRRVGVTLQIDEGPEVFDAKLGNLHPLFQQN